MNTRTTEERQAEIYRKKKLFFRRYTKVGAERTHSHMRNKKSSLNEVRSFLVSYQVQLWTEM